MWSTIIHTTSSIFDFHSTTRVESLTPTLIYLTLGLYPHFPACPHTHQHPRDTSHISILRLPQNSLLARSRGVCIANQEGLQLGTSVPCDIGRTSPRRSRRHSVSSARRLLSTPPRLTESIGDQILTREGKVLISNPRQPTLDPTTPHTERHVKQPPCRQSRGHSPPGG